MDITELMTTPVVTATPHMSVTDAVLLMLEGGATELPVVDDAGELVGIVGEADLFRARLGDEPVPLEQLTISNPDRGREVGEIMRRPVLTVQTRDPVTLCARLLGRHARSLPVLRGTEVIGIITRRVLLRALIRSDADVSADVAARLEPHTEQVGQWAVDVFDGVVTLSGIDDLNAWQATELAEQVDGVSRVDVRLRTSPGMHS
jgi:CBS domain-containing protein